MFSYEWMHVLHVVAAAIWIAVGFVMVLNDPVWPRRGAENTAAWGRLLTRLTPWHWGAVIVSWLTGIWLMFVYFGGFGKAGAHVDTMFLLAVIMTLIVGAEYAVSRPRLRRALASGETEAAERRIRAILRHGKAIFFLGLLTAAIASYGDFA